MGFFNEALLSALKGNGYYCSQCGAKMFFEDEDEETLICPKCGHETPFERYGVENDEDFEALYPTEEEVCGYDDEDEDEDDDNEYGEYYEEECDELSHDD